MYVIVPLKKCLFINFGLFLFLFNFVIFQSALVFVEQLICFHAENDALEYLSFHDYLFLFFLDIFNWSFFNFGNWIQICESVTEASCFFLHKGDLFLHSIYFNLFLLDCHHYLIIVLSEGIQTFGNYCFFIKIQSGPNLR